MNLTLQQIKDGIEDGSFVLSDNKLYTSEEWVKIQYAIQQESHFDLLQLTKKIQL